MSAGALDSGASSAPMGTDTGDGSGAVSPSPMGCGRAPCPEHGGLCAYHGNEPGRCPRCHCAWAVILRTGWHSCEKSSVWPDRVRAERMEQAATMRQKAAENSQEPDSGPFCPHLGATTGERREAVSPSGTRELVEVECYGCPRRFGVMVEAQAVTTCSRCDSPVYPTDVARSDWNDV